MHVLQSGLFLTLDFGVSEGTLRMAINAKGSRSHS